MGSCFGKAMDPEAEMASDLGSAPIEAEADADVEAALDSEDEADEVDLEADLAAESALDEVFAFFFDLAFQSESSSALRRLFSPLFAFDVRPGTR